MSRSDRERLNWLEHMAKQPGGLLLHSESGSTGRTGIGLRSDRSLRRAIDDAMPSDVYDIENRAGMGKEERTK